MENWLLIIVGVIFLVGIVAGAVRGFVKIGISLLSTVLTAALFAFLAPHVGNALAQYTPLDELIQEKKAEVTVLKSRDRWYGVTYKEDKPVVVKAIQSLKDQGLYPQKLWE